MLKRVARYEVLEQLGVGGMATVYLAKDDRLNRSVALKVMHPHLRSAPEALRRFDREAKSIAALRHPNIREIYDYSGPGEEMEYIATELLTGPTLKAFAASQTHIPAEIAACVCVQVAEALRAAHARGVIHRDVKPENILIHENKGLKLTDFGIAHMSDAHSFTATGEVLGSPYHMSPEHVNGAKSTPASDIFSLGTVLYFLATGQVPFSGDNPHQVIAKLCAGNYSDPLRVMPSMGEELAAIVRKALMLAPEDRYQSAENMLIALRSFLAGSGIDEPEKTLAAYLEAPEEQAELIAANTVTRLTQRAKDAVAKRDHALAGPLLSRVLALEPGNETALALLRDLDRRERQSKLLRFGALGTAAVALLTVAFFALAELLPEPAETESQQQAATEGQKDAAAVPAKATASPSPSPNQKPPIASAESAKAAAKSTRTDAAKKQVNETKRRAPSQVRGAAKGAPRRVIFRLYPQNIRIGIDGSTPKPFGPSFRYAELEPGPHRFELISGSSCCQDKTTTVNVPKGRGDYVLSRRLPYRPARIYVSSNAPADVSVANGLARGRTREVIPVPMGASESVVKDITVSAPGYTSVKKRAQLRAGELAELRVSLARATPTPEAKVAN